MELSVLKQTQEDRNQELSELMKIPIDRVKSYIIASPDSIRISIPENRVETQEDYENLYNNYNYLILVSYYKTLMYTSIYSRPKSLFQFIHNIKNQKCLDYGCGVGTHSILMLQNNNLVTLLDVVGSPFLSFCENRIKLRKFKYKDYQIVDNKEELQKQYDSIICVETLEHVYSQMKEIEKITTMLRPKGYLFLLVSGMIKESSGHFPKSILEWKRCGKDFMDKHYEKIENYVYRKKL